MRKFHLSRLACLICLSVIIKAIVSLVNLSHRMLSLALFLFFMCVCGGEGRGGPTYDNGLAIPSHAYTLCW